MNTLVLTEPGTFRYEDRVYPSDLSPVEALVRVRRIGVCGTDLHCFIGDMPFFEYPRVLGHELGVEVLETGSDVSGLSRGDYCAVEPYLNCGVCGPCRSGRTNCCAKLSVLGVHEDGGMCEQFKMPAHKLHRSTMLPLEHLALVEMLTIGAHAVRRAGIADRHKVAVVGAGPIGLSAIQFAVLAGARPVVVEMDTGRRDFCERFLDVAGTIDPAKDADTALRECFGGDLPDVVFDATGNQRAMQASFDLVGSGGTLVFIGIYRGDISFYNPEFHRKEMTLLSSRNATPADFSYVLQTLEEGKINLTPWITHRTPFDEAGEQFPRFLDRDEGVIKAMIDMDA